MGKVALAQAPPLNHSWSIALQVTPRGLSTRTLPHGHRSFTIQFDFIDHQLVIRHVGWRDAHAGAPAADRRRFLPRGDVDARRDGAAGEDLADAG